MQKPTAPLTAPIAQESLDRAIDAVVAIIIETLQSKSRLKFAEAARLCNIGQSLMRTQAKKIDDFAVLEVEDGPEENMGARINVGYNQAVGGIQYGGATDERATQREFMLTFGQNAQLLAEGQRANVATQEVTELQGLLTLRATLPEAQHEIVNRRIQHLMDRMEARNATGTAMVPADVSRGHQAGEGGAQEDVASGVRADANGAEGHGAVTFACRTQDIGPEAMGE